MSRVESVENLDDMLPALRQSIAETKTLAALEQCRVRIFGKHGYLTNSTKALATLPASERPVQGKQIHLARQELKALLEQRTTVLQQEILEAQLKAECIDVTLAGRAETLGGLHPVTRVRDRVCALFSTLGFIEAKGPEIESQYYNFDALNIPEHHPARTGTDTFYFQDGRLLRTHTSPVQIREMEKRQPPLRIITPGRVYRRDADHTHTPMFHQLEGLLVDRACTLRDLKVLLQSFLNQFFEEDIVTRFRPSYFPFTEPSAEMDIRHGLCSGSGCRTCGETGWLEVLGCGMVHPEVLRQVNINPTQYSGFAFGLGLDRLAMLRYGIDDLRLLFENDLSLLEQFS